MRRTTTSRWLTVATVAALALLAGCTSSNSDDDDAATASTTTTTELPPECEEFAADALRPTDPEQGEGRSTTTAPGDDAPTQTTLPPRCADALFGVAVEQSGSAELQELDAERRLGFAHGACAYASALTVDGTEPPTFKEFVATTAESWDVSPALVEEIVQLAGNLCPGQLAPLTDLQSGASQVTLRLQVTGTGTAQVSYQGPDGTTLQDEVSVPWDHEVTLGAPTDFRLSARIPDGEASCSIMVDDEVVVEETTTPGEEVACAVSAGDLRDAAR